jgi:hypothetical protein
MRAFPLVAGVVAGVFAFGGTGVAQDKKDQPDGPVVLKVVSKKDKYIFDGGGKTPKEYKAHLEDVAAQIAAGKDVKPPKPQEVDLVLQLENTSKGNVTVYIGGDPNVYTFDLSGGAGVVTMTNPVAFTLELRLPKPVVIEPGKTHDIPVKMLTDGLRGMSRLVFWTGPGEYTLVAKYTLANQDGDKVAELKSEPIKIKVEEK